ncbi:MAG TPA: hypothetical protein VJT83_06160 [Chitinophagaceae bacterium]|nr:hypothetical protein [Chitinophagaceae bacterium]
MRRISTLIAVLLAAIFIMSCRSSKMSASAKQDKDLFNAITAIEKSNNAEARQDLPGLVSAAVQRHEDNIAAYKNSNEPSRWQSIIAELEALQNIYSAIKASPAASKLVTAENYTNAIRDARISGANEFYDMGVQLLQSDDRTDARNAYKAFRAVNQIYPNYKDANSLLKQAEEKGVLDVVINPVETRGYMYGGYSFAADNFQRTLVRELGGNYGNGFSGARFYTEWDARSRKIKPDWVVDLTWSNMYIAPMRMNNYTRTVSKDVQTGKDANGKPIYQTVTATLYITQRNIQANGDMEYRIVSVDERQDVEWNRIPSYLDYSFETATYTGDSRALSAYDLSMVNNSRLMYNNESEIVDAMYQKVYPQLKNRIESATRW